MHELSLTQWDMILLALGAAVVAGHVRGFSGFGGPAVMMLVLTQFYSPASVLVLVLLADFVANLQLIPGSIQHASRRTIAPLVIASIVGLPAGVYALLLVDPLLAKRGIAIVSGLCACVMLTGWRYRREAGTLTTSAVGLVGGIVVGATFIALPIMIFLFAGPDAGARARANALAWGVFVSPVLIAVFVWIGLLGLDDLWEAALITVAYMRGAFSGARLFRRASELGFRRVVLVVLLGLSLVGMLT